MTTKTVALATHQTLTAGVADTITVTGHDAIEIKNRGTTDIYFRIDGVAAAVGADDNYILVAGEAITVAGPPNFDITSQITASIISSGAAAYSVTGA